MNELAKIVAEAFPFFGVPIDTELVFPEKFRGGFILRYEPSQSVKIQYLDWEFQVERAGTELFGLTNRGGFAGNTFSPEHLRDHVGQISEHVRQRWVEGVGMASSGLDRTTPRSSPRWSQPLRAEREDMSRASGRGSYPSPRRGQG